MQQVLFWIPIGKGVPIYGFGVMLLLAFVAAVWLLVRMARRQGFDPDRILDLVFWVIIAGLIGARIVYMIQYKRPIGDFYKIWEGGIVFYGSALGGWVGYGLVWLYLRYRKNIHISTWRLADIVAPTVCIGLAVGRVGCLLNGCCYGHVCTDAGVRFPLLTAPARELVVYREGYQTAAGFSIDDTGAVPGLDLPAKVGAVEPGSPAAAAGLKAGDLITAVNGQSVNTFRQLQHLLLEEWPRGQDELRLTVTRLPGPLAFTPKTLKLHPTQVYETITMLLLFFALMAAFPYRRYYGQVFVWLMIGYAFHRFFNETLRNDTDPVVANLTLSQVGSIGVLAAGLLLWGYLWKFGERVAPPAPAAK